MAKKILIYGYGNPGRQDDGLGNALVEDLENRARQEGLDHLFFDSNYQLNIEDAANIAEMDLVIFADASTEEINDIDFTPVDESTHVAFTSHAASPGYIVNLCREIYEKTPAVYLLHIKGYEWAFKEGLTAKAYKNLELASSFIQSKIKEADHLIESFHQIKIT
ncbi:MAG: hydrogenase maturation protease [Bacteroidales bacterium]|nr:hydrogenase maturation protease [Bacteroidales bacterium]